MLTLALTFLVLASSGAEAQDDPAVQQVANKLVQQWQAGDARAVLATLDEIESLGVPQTEVTLFLRAQAHDRLEERVQAIEVYKDYLAAYGATGRYSAHILQRVAAGELDLGEDLPRRAPGIHAAPGTPVSFPDRIFSESEAAVRDCMVNGAVGAIVDVNTEGRTVRMLVDVPERMRQPLQALDGRRVVELGAPRQVGPNEYTAAVPAGAELEAGLAVYTGCRPGTTTIPVRGEFDASGLGPLRATYRILLQGMEVGTWTYEWRREGALFRVGVVQSLAQMTIDVSTTFDAGSFQPREHTLKPGPMPEMRITVENGRASGNGMDMQTGQPIEVDTEVPEGVWLDGMAEIAIALTDFSAVDRFTFRALGMSGAVQPRTVTLEGEEAVTVPAGDFETYRLDVAGPTPMTMWVTRSAPHLIVKREVPGQQPLTFELMELHTGG